MTTTIKKYYANLSHDALLLMLDDVEAAWRESQQQWNIHCEDCKKGFAHETSFNRKEVEKRTNERRMYWFLKKEADFKAYDEYSTFLNDMGFWIDFENNMK